MVGPPKTSSASVAHPTPFGYIRGTPRRTSPLSLNVTTFLPRDIVRWRRLITALLFCFPSVTFDSSVLSAGSGASWQVRYVDLGRQLCLSRTVEACPLSTWADTSSSHGLSSFFHVSFSTLGLLVKVACPWPPGLISYPPVYCPLSGYPVVRGVAHAIHARRTLHTTHHTTPRHNASWMLASRVGRAWIAVRRTGDNRLRLLRWRGEATISIEHLSSLSLGLVSIQWTSRA
jgi:hypothetical protein